MSDLLHENGAFLHMLMSKDTPKAQVKSLLESISKDQLNCLTEIAHNLLKYNIDISENHKSSLKKYADRLRILSKPKLPLKKRKEVLNPAFVVALLRAVAPSLRS